MQDLPVDNLLTVDQAISVLDAHVIVPRQVSRALGDPLLVGSVLAEDVRADRDDPPADRSLMDGYAVTAADCGTSRLRVIGEVPAGASWNAALAAGDCVAIMTGAPLPAGAAAVVPVEHVTPSGDFITLHERLAPGQAVARAASYLTRGAVVLGRGTCVTPAAIGLLAAVGAAAVRVIDRPRVGILTSGDEIVPHAQAPLAQQQRNATAPMLHALVTAAGGIAIEDGHAADTADAVRSSIAAAHDCDLLLVAGGMSVGNYDFVPAVLRDGGYAMPVTKLRIKPGKPFVFATRDRHADARVGPPIVCGLPGNPVSGFVCTLLLATRLIRRLSGRPAATPWRGALLVSDLPPNGTRAFYQPAIVEEGDEPRARVLPWKGSADLLTLAAANALIVRPENDSARNSGDRVQFTPLPA